jgi:Cytochrome c oxidase subunit VII
MSEAPFVPREKLLEKQRLFQNVKKHTYLRGRYDAVTSVGIPLALAATSLFLIVYQYALPSFLLNFIDNKYIKPNLVLVQFSLIFFCGLLIRSL